jgi:hypothetical protein
MALHKKHTALDTMVHELLTYAMLSNAAAVLLEAIFPRNFLISCARIGTTYIQCGWFWAATRMMFEGVRSAARAAAGAWSHAPAETRCQCVARRVGFRVHTAQRLLPAPGLAPASTPTTQLLSQMAWHVYVWCAVRIIFTDRYARTRPLTVVQAGRPGMTWTARTWRPP